MKTLGLVGYDEDKGQRVDIHRIAALPTLQLPCWVSFFNPTYKTRVIE
ncbi:hypothetical protein IQ249_18570 [Lusitaniella coriacea LEGE 07157]|uniref:Uncharacterized protein n=1 Tax=Lusitaniella coriacea LEGE 07157 TaxID=945747 RepID=A0A8J7DZ57_9CYAN|nr:hypothetical protein [Lusitaniella coriacea]MBE9117905.1 hypothetical protein [Lusitaniella coriacea LEGE 07157]